MLPLKLNISEELWKIFGVGLFCIFSFSGYILGSRRGSLNSFCCCNIPISSSAAALPPQIPEVGAERILDTVEQIRLKYVPSLVFVTLCD